MDIIRKMNGVYFNWKDNLNTGRQIGFIAQDVKKILPEVVIGTEGDITKGETLSMAYQNIVPVLVEALKEKDIEIINLNKRISLIEETIKNYQFPKQNFGSYEDQFNLQQNKPNPFSDKTIISYSIFNDGYVLMDLYSIEGKKIQTLENSYKRKGNYQIQINGKSLINGYYFYTMKLNGKQISKKAIKF